MNGKTLHHAQEETPHAASVLAFAADPATQLSRVLGMIYDCATDPGLWPAALAAIDEYLSGAGSRIFLFNSHPDRDGFGSNFGITRDFNNAFDADIETLTSIKYSFVVSEIDTAVTMSEVLEANGGRDINGLFPEDNRLYREWLAPRRSCDALSVLLVKTKRRFGGIAMMRAPELPPFGG